ncbi:hypothetical protein EYF80_039715 [Liparis tanakae]|uniref:Uncharacterized protein n=1 Tax=Liparis tanakae TaxID=230148 RepID=A0A4Z2G9B0_9TELE|nr:hypothetical protein EYF80_039715 [Liparis tanakae]
MTRHTICFQSVYSHCTPSVGLGFEGDGSCGNHVFSIFIGGHGEQELLVERLLQQLENGPAVAVVGQISTNPQARVRPEGVRVFLLREESLS